MPINRTFDGKERRSPQLLDVMLRCRLTAAPKMIVRKGLGRETDAVSGIAKTTPVFSTGVAHRPLTGEGIEPSPVHGLVGPCRQPWRGRIWPQSQSESLGTSNPQFFSPYISPPRQIPATANRMAGIWGQENE